MDASTDARAFSHAHLVFVRRLVTRRCCAVVQHAIARRRRHTKTLAFKERLITSLRLI